MSHTSEPERQSEPTEVLRVTSELASLGRMTGPELAAKYVALYGQPSRSRNKAFLRKRLAWRIQELAEGGLSECTLARIEELGAIALASRRPPVRGDRSGISRPRAPLQVRDPRLPGPKTVIKRLFRAEEHAVTVLEDGFEYRGEKYRSLSRIARLITGTPWNGYLFFFGRARGTKPPQTGER